jgi:5-dehydro-2-deoxygluconokinase
MVRPLAQAARVEILVPRQGEPEAEFEATGRPAIVAALIRRAYARGLTPAFWKIEGTPSAEGARTIDLAVAEHPGGRHIILGKAADLPTILQWFHAAAASLTAAGFAIGRSVFWEACVEFLTGGRTATEAADAVADRYLQLVAAWITARGVSPSGDNNG